MFDAKREILDDGRMHKYRILRGALPLRYNDAIRLWQHDDAFRAVFLSILSEVPFAAYRWETPPVTADTVDRAFEFVILNSPGLDLPSDPSPFAEYFTDTNANAGIVVFDNLGNDATLVAPSPRGPASAYPHLAAFTRQAPASQNHALWRTVGETMRDQLSDRPTWLSTAGGGVAWLHVRLDSWPKYYEFRPYREFP